MGTIITNKHNLPETFVNAVKVDRHKVVGDISVTQLIDAPQVRILKKTNTIEEDVVDRIHMLMGTAVHKVLELAEINNTEAKSLKEAMDVLEYKGYAKAVEFIAKVLEKEYPNHMDNNVLLEHTMSIEIGGMTLSGTADRILAKESIIEDYKNTSVFSYIYPESRRKWGLQLNIYAYMYQLIYGKPIEGLRVVAIFKDWNEQVKLRSGSDYPPQKVMYIPIKLSPMDKVEAYIKKRVELHLNAEKGNVTECTNEDRWASADVFALMKVGGKKAIKKFITHKEAEFEMKKIESKYPPKSLYVETRKGYSKRCSDGFCSVAKYCSQFKRELEGLDQKEIE
jgi:hypothetical protein